ncbi:MAG: N-acetylmuramoyl-L-alanine amidase [Acidimicrobiia bacterium]|nr:N-acetylmuramoyl-L-alanine amidase [Acidimicrobiia bacterium]
MPRRHLVVSAVVAAVLAMAGCSGADPAIGGAAAMGVATGDGAARQPGPTAAPPGDAVGTSTTTTPADLAEVSTGIAVVAAGGADLAETAGGEPIVRAAEGLPLPVVGRAGEWLEIVTSCNSPAWVQASQVELTPQAAGGGGPGPGFDLSAAVVMLDPGHGDRDWGAIGPEGLSEKVLNLDIAARVRDLMQRSNTVDWTTGTVTSGGDIPAFGAVWMTRPPEGPNEGQFEAGLAYRAELANAAGADAMVSIHNNTVPKVASDIPGTEVFYSVAAPGSDRLAALLYEEVVASLSAFEADWMGGELLGARARINPDTGEDYYGLLRRAQMPAAIVEGLYLSEPQEEALLGTDAVKQAYAEGVYRAVVRFLTTDDVGSGLRDPEPYPEVRTPTGTSACVVPAQP